MQMPESQKISALIQRFLKSIRATPDKTRFANGTATGGEFAKPLKNVDLAAGKTAGNPGQPIRDALLRDSTFVFAVHPRNIAVPMLSRCNVGQHYGRHVDNPLMGPRNKQMRSDISVTAFISKPQDYDGGELVVEGTDGESAYKLAFWCTPPPGSTGYPQTLGCGNYPGGELYPT